MGKSGVIQQGSRTGNRSPRLPAAHSGFSPALSLFDTHSLDRGLQAQRLAPGFRTYLVPASKNLKI